MNGGPPAMSTFPRPYQPPDVILPPSGLSDPFLETQPIGTGFSPHHSRGIASYRLPSLHQNIPAEYQSFAASRTVPPGQHLSPLETYVARSRESLDPDRHISHRAKNGYEVSRPMRKQGEASSAERNAAAALCTRFVETSVGLAREKL